MQAHVEDTFQQLCRQKGLAVTHQRLVVYRELMQMHGHPNPEQVFDRVRREIPSISLATVYKTIHAFLKSEMIREVSPHHGTLRIEPNRKQHHHFICLQCHSIIDLAQSEMDDAPLIRSVPEGFHVEQVSMEVRGLCGLCSESNLSTNTP